jgi:hypothetical protein
VRQKDGTFQYAILAPPCATCDRRGKIINSAHNDRKKKNAELKRRERAEQRGCSALATLNNWEMGFAGHEE